MSERAITEVRGRGVHVPGADLDTDRIIPARFLRCVTFDGLGEQLFWDVRFEPDGTPRPHPLNDERFAGASVLLSGRNFGCGSSREHAPQSIARAGFSAVIAESFAEIFFGNSLTLGLVCATASAADIEAIGAAIEADPSVELVLDVASERLTVGALTVALGIPDTARGALVAGQWDPLAGLRGHADEVQAVYDRLPYTSWGGA